jgi:hypothetical protein
LRTIIQKPELAALVKVAVLDGQDFDGSIRYYKHQSPKLAVTGDDLKPLVEYIRTTNVSYCDESIQELRSVTMDASVTLQLSQLPSPKSIYLGETSLANAPLSDVSFGPPSVRGAIAFIPFNIYTASQCCILVLVLANEAHNGENHGRCPPSFYLPTVERIRAFINNPEIFEWPATCPPTSQSLRSLDLIMRREGNLGKVQ